MDLRTGCFGSVMVNNTVDDRVLIEKNLLISTHSLGPERRGLTRFKLVQPSMNIGNSFERTID